jgi:hypothetical protein
MQKISLQGEMATSHGRGDGKAAVGGCEGSNFAEKNEVKKTAVSLFYKGVFEKTRRRRMVFCGEKRGERWD